MAHPERPEESGRACRTSRRKFLWDTAGGLGSVALTGMLGSEFLAAQALGAGGTHASPIIA